MNSVFRIVCLGFLFFSSLLPQAGFARQSGPKPGGASASDTTNRKSTAATAPSPAAIADAKAKGLVWVNLSTRVYHKDGPLYGATKHGKFLTEVDAKKAGYRLARDNQASAKTAGSTTGQK